ncbi:MAG: SUMF1/EgtB/PvdO family nonheme iron enzyme [Planctomycetota bacterium]
MKSLEERASQAPIEVSDDYDAEESLLRGLDGWVGDDFEAESHCGRALAKVRAFGDTCGDSQGDTQPKTQDKTACSRVGPYTLLGFIGQGGMGRVFKAKHVRLGRVVALKVLSSSSSLKSQTTKRFQREMRALGRIDHPNIVTASDAGVRDGVHFLAMEFVDGISFAEILRHEERLETADACELIRQTAVALAAAHAIGMVHRDIKPSNLMLTMDTEGRARVKVLDFGLALFRNESDFTDELTHTGQVVGTLEYMPPEQCLNSHNVDHRADLYSLGATINKLLCDGSPFQETQSELTPMQRLLRRVEEPLPSIATRRPDLPNGLVELIDHLLQEDPERRSNSADVIAKELAAYCTGHQLERLFHRLPRPPVDTDLGYLTVAANTVPPSKTHSLGSRFGIIAAALLAIGLVGFGLSRSARPAKSNSAPIANRGSDLTPTIKNEYDEALWDLTTSLVGYWPVTTNEALLEDRSGGGLHLDLGDAGVISNARAPAGGPHSLQVTKLRRPLVIHSSHTAQSATIAFWFRGRRLGSKSTLFLAQNANGFEMRYGCNMSDQPGHFIFRVPTANGETFTLSSQASFNTRAWHHVAIVNEEDSSLLYIDGHLDSSVKGHLLDFEKPLEVGGDENMHSIELDEIALFDRPLTQIDVRKLITTRPTPRPMLSSLCAGDVARTQQAWSEHLNVPSRWSNSLGMEFCLIPPGEYLMGSNAETIEQEIAGDGRIAMWDRYRSEGPQHRVRITTPFFIGAHEVTQAQYRRGAGENPAYFQAGGNGNEWIGDVDSETLPVESVSWLDAIEYCQQLSRLENLPPCYREEDEELRMADKGYRLPTEAEWEFACRAGTTTRWFCGENEGLRQHAHWVANSPRCPSPVGSLSPNPLGLFDTHGNVFEWCFDYYDEDWYANEAAMTLDPTGPKTGLRRVYRSGSWWQRKSQTRSAFRGHHFPSFQYQEHGMRLVLSVEAVKQALVATPKEEAPSLSPQ